MDDRISQLPDDILSYILTMLSIKDLLKTSVLSKRWCKLWGLRKDLSFDIHNVLGSENELLELGHLIDDTRDHSARKVNLDLSLSEFVKRVDQFVKNFPGTAVGSFSVNFYLDCEQSNTIDQWISFAIARGVERINLLFLENPYGHQHATRNKDYKFDFALFLEASTIKHLRLENCLVFHPTNCDFTRFQHLRSLSLSKVKVDEIFIESLLSNCQLLEELCLDYCLFKSSVPKIVSSSLCHLKVSGCYHLYYKNVARHINLMLVDCLKLTSLECPGSDLSTLNIYTHVLKRIYFSVSIEEFLDAFALCATFPELEIMRLEILYITNTMVMTSLKMAQPLKHLKQLDCVVSLYFVEDCDLVVILNIILQASPLLQKLSVTMEDPRLLEEQKDIRDVEVFSHDELKVIEFGGCVGNWFEIEFVLNVLKYAHKLEQIVVNSYWKYDYSLDSKSNSMRFHSGREKMIEKFQGEEIVGREKLVFNCSYDTIALYDQHCS